MMRRFVVPVLGAVLLFTAPLDTTFAQAKFGGGDTWPFLQTKKTWSFEAEVAYTTQGQQTNISQMTFLPDRGAVKSWTSGLPVRTPITTSGPPRILWTYHPRYKNVVFKSQPSFRPGVFQPVMPSCLLALKAAISTSGEAAVRKRYAVPADFPITDYQSILKEERVGANSGPRPGSFPGSNFYVNDMPSGFGYPPLMFRLLVGTPEAFRAGGIIDLKLTGKERVAGFVCQKYTSAARHTMFWVEPQTQLVLRRDTLIVWPRPPGSRVPPMKPYREGYVVRKFRILKNAPDSLFLPPPGSTVELPELLYDMPLPSGVKRRRMKGMMAKLGVPLAPFPSNGAEVIR